MSVAMYFAKMVTVKIPEVDVWKMILSNCQKCEQLVAWNVHTVDG